MTALNLLDARNSIHLFSAAIEIGGIVVGKEESNTRRNFSKYQYCFYIEII